MVAQAGLNFDASAEAQRKCVCGTFRKGASSYITSPPPERSSFPATGNIVLQSPFKALRRWFR
jgi:hypothetical protein